jgi:hypothetical protein
VAPAARLQNKIEANHGRIRTEVASPSRFCENQRLLRTLSEILLGYKQAAHDGPQAQRAKIAGVHGCGRPVSAVVYLDERYEAAPTRQADLRDDIRPRPQRPGFLACD